MREFVLRQPLPSLCKTFDVQPMSKNKKCTNTCSEVELWSPLGFFLWGLVITLVLMDFPVPILVPAHALSLVPDTSSSPASSHAHRAACKAAGQQKQRNFLQGKPKSGIKEKKGCVCVTLSTDCRDDTVATIPFPFSGTASLHFAGASI